MPLADNLISYWKLDEASGAALDAHSSNDLATFGAPGAGTGKINGDRTFSGTNQSFFHASNAALQTGDIDFTLQAWVNLSSKAAIKAFLGKWTGAGNYEYALYYNNAADRFEFHVSSSGAAGTAISVAAATFGSPSTGTWYLIHAWHDSINNLLGIAVNAGTADTTAHSLGVYVGSAIFEMGSLEGLGFYFHEGSLDECALFKRVLPSGQRTQLFNGGAGMSYAAILADTGGGSGGRRGSKFGRGFN